MHTKTGTIMSICSNSLTEKKTTINCYFKKKTGNWLKQEDTSNGNKTGMTTSI